MRTSLSPRWRGHPCRPVAENALTLRFDRAIRTMLANGKWAGQPIVRTWTRDGQVIASCQISLVYSASGELRVQLTTRVGTMARTETITIDWVSQRLGGRRAWWLCPRCQQRSGVLFNLLGPSWRCRRCYKISYRSSNSSDRRITDMLHNPNLVAALSTLNTGNSISNLVLRQKAGVIIRRRARRDYRRWFRRTFPGRHLPQTVRRKRDSDHRDT